MQIPAWPGDSRLPRARKDLIPNQVYCMSDDHNGTIHNEGDTDPFGYGYAVCSVEHHRPVYAALKRGDYPVEG